MCGESHAGLAMGSRRDMVRWGGCNVRREWAGVEQLMWRFLGGTVVCLSELIRGPRCFRISSQLGNYPSLR